MTKIVFILFAVGLFHGAVAWAQTPATIFFAENSYSVFEESTNGAFISVFRLGDTNGTVSVHFATSDGTATAGLDYVATNGTVTFVPGERSSGFMVPIINDNITVPVKTVRLELRDPTGGAVLPGVFGAPTNYLFSWLYVNGTGDRPATVYLQFDSSPYTVSEADGAAIVSVVRQGPTSRAVTVQYTTSDGTAIAGQDYTATNGTVTFGPGEITKTISVPVRNDGVAEGTEFFKMVLSNPTGTGATLGNPIEAYVYVTDTGAGVHFSQPSFDVAENGGAAMIRVTLAGEFTNVVTVDYATSDGTAAAGQDYVATNGTLTFAPGQGSQTFSVPILNDSLVEGTETVNLTLSNPTGRVVLGSPSTGVLYINDNDSISLDSSDYDVYENDRTVTVNVQRFGDANAPVTVNYFTSDGLPSDYCCLPLPKSALAGVDYLPTAGTLALAIGETSKLFTIPILDNGRVDGDRIFTVNLIVGTFPLSQSQITIHDNEIPALIDPGFNPGTGVTSQQFGSPTVYALAVQADGKILIGGTFDTVEDVGRTNIARLNPNGSLDTNFIASTSLTDSFGNVAQVSAVALQANGQIVLAGNFTAVDDVTLNGLARLNADGSLDTNFNPSIILTNQFMDQNGNPISAAIKAAVVQANGKIILGGTFDTVNGLARTNLARLNRDGSLDTSVITGTELIYDFIDPWDPLNRIPVAAAVSALALQGDGAIVVGGTFTTVNGAGRNGIVRLNKDGSLDNSFFVGDGVEDGDNPGTVKSITIQPDGGILIAGQFTSVHGIGRNNLARLNPDGSLDPNFGLAENRRVDALASENDGFVMVADSSCDWGCSFTLKRLNPDGSLDDTFPLVRGEGLVKTMAVQPDGNVLIGGSFYNINLNNGADSIVRPGIARLYGNPGQPRIQFVSTQDPNTGIFSADITVNENAGVAIATVQRVGDTSNALTVDYATSDGTAKAGLNYVAANGALAFAALEVSKTINIPVLDDHLARYDLQFRVALSHPTSGGALGLSTLTVTVRNPDIGFSADGITRQANGQVTLSLYAPDSAHYVLEGSSNLTDWVQLGTNVLTFTDTTAPMLNQRFYRARLLTQ